MRIELKERAELISKEVPRVALKQLIATVFMGFKQLWLHKKTLERKIQPMLDRKKETRIRNAMVHWKWLMHYKHTKRSYLKHCKAKYELELQKDVFNSLKFYRFTIYNVVSKIQSISNNQVFKLYQSCFDKVRNFAANERDELNYERGRVLFTLLSGKIGKLQRMKQKVLMKWNAHLIPRLHYLPTILKRMELNALKSAFAMINEKKFWN